MATNNDDLEFENLKTDKNSMELRSNNDNTALLGKIKL